jgi:hypothetical protein
LHLWLFRGGVLGNDRVQALHRGFDVGNAAKDEMLEFKNSRSQILVAVFFFDAA